MDRTDHLREVDNRSRLAGSSGANHHEQTSTREATTESSRSTADWATRVQGSGHGVIICVGSGPGFDLVTQDGISAGVTRFGGREVLAELGDGGGCAAGSSTSDLCTSSRNR